MPMIAMGVGAGASALGSYLGGKSAAKEAAARNPASEAQVDINGDKVAVPLKGFMPKGSYVGNKVGQQESPDMTGVASAPEMDSKAARLAKIKALFQNK